MTGASLIHGACMTDISRRNVELVNAVSVRASFALTTFAAWETSTAVPLQGSWAEGVPVLAY